MTLINAVDLVINSLAASEAFQEMVGAENATLAEHRIYFVETEPPVDANVEYQIEELLDRVRPYAAVAVPDNGYSLFLRGAQNGFICSGQVDVKLERTTPDNLETVRQIERDWYSVVGSIMREMSENSGIHPYPDIQAISMTSAPKRSHPLTHEALGDYQWAVFNVAWGVTQ